MHKYNKNSIKYRKNNIETVTVDVQKGTKDIWKAYAESKGIPLATLIKNFIIESMEKDGFVYENPSEKES